VPRRRTVQPLWLEQRGNLHYLHGYCYLAEADRVFRLDRVLDVEDGAANLD
jgi:predicted DNA-binding transcriptional regulator YafY